jgi:hypothetical protein
LHHILVRRLRSFSSCKIGSEFCPMVNLKKGICTNLGHEMKVR